MADIAITAALVKATANPRANSGLSGDTVVAGKTLAQNPATKKFVLADSNHADAWRRQVKAIALSGASDGQPLFFHKSGPLDLGANVLTPGEAYYQSDTPGGICPLADVGVGENVVLIGLAKTAAILIVEIADPGVTK